MSRGGGLAGLMLVFLSACAASPAPPAATGDAVRPAAERGEILAVALADADRARERGDLTALKRSLAIIRRLRARPLDDEARAERAEWDALVPDDAPPVRGRALGPGYHRGTIGGARDRTFEQIFLSGKKSVVSLATPDGSPLALRITGGSGKRICGERAPKAICKWTPIFTQRHVIEIANPGRSRVSYYLVID